MERDKKGRFKEVLGLRGTEDVKRAKYQELWRKRNPKRCPRCTKRDKAPNLSLCLECTFGETGAAELKSPNTDLVEVIYPRDGSSRMRAFTKMTRKVEKK